jgi:hypothetical protein
MTERADQNKNSKAVNAGTIAGRAGAPVAPKPDAENAPGGSPGAAADREQAKEQE